MKKLTVEDLDLQGKRVLMRVDFNVPLEDGKVANDKRIKAALPTISYIVKNGGKLILMSNLGRPKGQRVPEMSLKPCVAVLSELTGKAVAFVDDCKTEKVMQAARDAGATGATIISNARGEGLKKTKTFFGLSLETQRDVLLFLVEEHLSRHILEKIGEVGEFDSGPGTGIAIQIDVEDAVGVAHQIEELVHVVEDEL